MLKRNIHTIFTKFKPAAFLKRNTMKTKKRKMSERMSAEDVVYNILFFLRNNNKPTTSKEIAMNIGCTLWNIERYMKAIRQYGKIVEYRRKQCNTYYYFVAENTKIYGKDVMKIAWEVRRKNNEYKQVCRENKKIKINAIEIDVEEMTMKERIKRFFINLIKKI